jgi:MFS family permease
VGALAGSVVATRLRPRRPLVLMAYVEGVFGVPLAFLAAGAPAPLLAVSAFVSGAALMVGMSVWMSTLQRHIPDEWLSRVSSYDWFGSFAFYAFGLGFWGVLAEAIGVHETLWVAFGLLIASAAGLWAMPDIRNFRESPAEAPVA